MILVHRITMVIRIAKHVIVTVKEVHPLSVIQLLENVRIISCPYFLVSEY